MTNQPLEMPLSEDSDKGLLCSILLSPREIANQCCLQTLRDLFYIPAHSIIFDAIIEFLDQGRPLDFRLLKQRLDDTKQLPEVGGLDYLSALYAFVPCAANWSFYVDVLKDKYRRRCFILAAQKLLTIAYDPDSTPADTLEMAEQTLAKLALEPARQGRSWKELVLETVDVINKRAEMGTIAGIQFGIPPLDEELGGVEPGECCVICAETSGGKSALATQAILHTAGSQKKASAIFSLEMPTAKVIIRMLSHLGEISMKSLKIGRLTPNEHSRYTPTISKISTYPIFADNQDCSEISHIINRCRQLKAKEDIQLVVVDYLQLVENTNRRKSETRQIEVADVSRRLNLMAKELNLAVIALSQLNDDGHLRESRAIGHDADIVLEISTPGKTEDAFRRSIFIKKNRDGERGKMIPVSFYGQYMRFEPQP